MRRSICERNVLILRIMRICMMSMAFPIATIVAFWESNGVSLQEGLALQALFAVMLAIFEVPSGYIADCLGRKRTLVAGGLGLFLGSLVYFQGSGFYDFLLGEALLAVGFAMISGADEALLYDSLLTEGRQAEHQRTWGRIAQGEFYMAAAAILLGALVALWSLRAAYLLALVGYAGYIIAALRLEEPSRQRPMAEDGHIRQLLSIARYCFVSRPKLRWVMIYSGLMVASLQISFWLYQPYLSEAGLSLAWNGYVLAILNLFAAAVSANAYRVEQRFGRRGSMRLCLALQAGSLFLLAFWVGPFGWCIFLVHQFVRAVLRVVLSDYINREARSEVRATVISLRGLSDRLLYALALIPFNLHADSLGAGNSYLMLALITSLGGMALLLYIPARREVRSRAGRIRRARAA